MGQCCAGGQAGKSNSAALIGNSIALEPDLPVFKDLPLLTEEEVSSKFKLQEVLGKGSFATVYSTIETNTNQQYAMKVIKVQSLGEQSERIPNLRKEVEICLSFSHPNILSMKKAIQTSDHIYLLMEHVSGGELFKLLELNQWRGWRSEEEAKKILIQVLHGVQYMHSKHVVHGDIKPENILCSVPPPEVADGLVPQAAVFKLIDFGFSSFVKKSDGQKLKGLVGTMEYAAPEIFDDGGYGLEADMWSVGILLHLVLAGELPVNVSNKADLDLLKQGNFSMNSENWGSVSKEAKQLVRQLTRVDAKKRLSATQALENSWFSGISGVESTDHTGLGSPVLDVMTADTSLQTRQLRAEGTTVPFVEIQEGTWGRFRPDVQWHVH